MGALASSYIASQTELDDRAQVQTVAGLQHIEVAVDEPAPDVFRASGVGNTFLIRTDEGNVLFDTGLATQAARHKRLLQEAVPGEITHIVLSHSHADHIGGAKFWLAEFPDAQVVTHAEFVEGQRYLDDLERHFWSRNRLLYAFMPEEPPESGMNVYGGITPTIEVIEGDVHSFTLGGVRFEAIAAAGAEGDDNLVLWLPEQRLLFSGDFFGPLFPMVPNLFTLRGEKFRDPIAYVRSIDRLIALGPEMVLPSHFDPVSGAEQIHADMRKMRDATRFIHDQTVAGMNAGKSLWQLMDEVRLPPELALSQATARCRGTSAASGSTTAPGSALNPPPSFTRFKSVNSIPTSPNWLADPGRWRIGRGRAWRRASWKPRCTGSNWGWPASPIMPGCSKPD